MNRYIDADKYRKDLLSAYDDISMEFEVLDRQPTVKAVSIDRIKQTIAEIENTSTYDGIYIDRADVLAVLDKLIEEVEG